MGIARSIDEIDIWLSNVEELYGRPAIVVVEDFALFKNKAVQQSGSRMEASQVIGIVKSYVRRWESKIQIQPANILPMAVLYTKAPLPKNHDKSHHISAYNHGFYFLVKNNYVYPVGVTSGVTNGSTEE